MDLWDFKFIRVHSGLEAFRERERVNTDVFNTDLRFINASFFVRLETENRLYLGSAVMMAV